MVKFSINQITKIMNKPKKDIKVNKIEFNTLFKLPIIDKKNPEQHQIITFLQNIYITYSCSKIN